MNQTEKKAIVAIVLMIFSFVTGIYLYRQYALSDYECTYAIYQGIEGSGKGKEWIFSFTTGTGEEVRTNIDTDRRIDIGDTVWIKYSLSDPTVAEFIDYDYKKYMKSIHE